MRKSIESQMLLLLLGLLAVTQVLPMYPVAACNPDFTLTVSPNSSTVQKGSSERLTLTVTSVCGLDATVSVGWYSSSPSNGPLLIFARYDIHVSPTAPLGTTRITVGTTNTASGTYTITTTGKGIQNIHTSHSTTFTITVA
jgi:hypothetical protein